MDATLEHRMLDADPPHLSLNRVAFDDMDAMSGWVSGIGWDLESTQLSAGPTEIRYDQVTLADVTVARLRIKQSVRDLFTVPNGFVVFTITRADAPIIWLGRQFRPSLMRILRSGIDHCVVLPPGWDAYEITVPERLIEEDKLLPPPFWEDAQQPEHAYLPLVDPAACRLIQGLDAAFASSAEADGFRAGVSCPQFRNFVVHGLLEAAEAGFNARGSGRPIQARRPDLVTKVADLVESNLDGNLSVDRISRELNISSRALNYAFRANLGVSPYRYVLTRKLCEVRRQLKTSDEPITEVISRYGFETPSRFRRQYRNLFGEHPSETRARG